MNYFILVRFAVAAALILQTTGRGFLQVIQNIADIAYCLIICIVIGLNDIDTKQLIRLLPRKRVALFCPESGLFLFAKITLLRLSLVNTVESLNATFDSLMSLLVWRFIISHFKLYINNSILVNSSRFIDSVILRGAVLFN